MITDLDYPDEVVLGIVQVPRLSEPQPLLLRRRDPPIPLSVLRREMAEILQACTARGDIASCAKYEAALKGLDRLRAGLDPLTGEPI